MKKIIILTLIFITGVILSSCDKKNINVFDVDEEAIFYVQNSEKKVGAIKSDHTIAIPFIYDNCLIQKNYLYITKNNEIQKIYNVNAFENGNYKQTTEEEIANLIDKKNNLYLNIITEDNKQYLVNDLGEKQSKGYAQIQGKNNIYVVKNDDLYGILNRDGDIILDIQYPFVQETYNGDIIITDESSNQGLFSLTFSELIIPIQYKKIYTGFSNYGLLIDQEDNKFFFENKQITSVSTNILIDMSLTDNIFTALNDNNYFFYYANGEKSKNTYDTLSTFVNGHAIFTNGNQIGVIDRQENIIWSVDKKMFTNEGQTLRILNEKYIQIITKEKKGLISINGKKIVDTKYNDILLTENAIIGTYDNGFDIYTENGDFVFSKENMTFMGSCYGFKGYIMCKQEKYYIIMTLNGKEIIDKNDKIIRVFQPPQ